MVRLPEGKIGVLEGLKDYIVVDTDKALLVLPKEKEQEIKQWVSKVKDTFGPDFI
jgi:mannose-1-phosphate guanylyltransferase